MINQSSTDSLESFGVCYDKPLHLQKSGFICHEISAASRKIDNLLNFPCEVHIECPPGLALLLIAAADDITDLQTFPLRHHVKLAAGTRFNLIPLSAPLAWRLFLPKAFAEHMEASCLLSFTEELPSPYTYQPVSVPFYLRQILDCWFTGQTDACRLIKAPHKFYELIYVYEGSLTITLSSGTHSLYAHDLIIYHADDADIHLTAGCSYLTVVFDVCQKNHLYILDHIFHCTSEMQQILWKLLIESPEHSYYTRTLMLCYLQEVLLLLMQFHETRNHKTLLSDNKAAQNDLLSEILVYMNEHLTEQVTMEEICHEFYISRSTLQTLFKTHLNTSPKNYLLNMKLQKSKELIRENQYTISEIAYKLGFSSIHYFSRLFKKYFNITPSAYARKAAKNESPQQSAL